MLICFIRENQPVRIVLRLWVIIRMMAQPMSNEEVTIG